MGYARWILAVSNFSLWLTGIGLMGAAIHITSLYGSSFFFANTIFPHSFVIGISVILIIVGVLGWYGALADSDWMLMLFSITMSVIFVMEVVGAAALYAHRNILLEGGEASFEAVMKDYDKDSRFIILLTFQNESQCCGRMGPEDYNARKYGIPGSCCEKNSTSHCSMKEAHKLGCEDGLKRLLDEGMDAIAPLVTGFASCHLVLMIVTFVCTYIVTVERRRHRYASCRRNIFKRMRSRQS